MSETKEEQTDEKADANRPQILIDHLRRILNPILPMKRGDDWELADHVEALMTNHERYLRLIETRRSIAEQRVREARRLKDTLLFIGRCTRPQAGPWQVAQNPLNLTMERILRQAAQEIEALAADDQAVIEGVQDYLMDDAVVKLHAVNEAAEELGQRLKEDETQ